MANNYLQFSEQILNLTPDELQWVKEFLNEAPPEDDDPALALWLEDRAVEAQEAECYPNFQWEADTNLWIYAEEYADLVQVAVFIKLFLKRFRPLEIFSLTYAETCSKMRVGEFSGGWITVSAREICYGHCNDSASKDEEMLRENLRIKRSKKNA